MLDRTADLTHSLRPLSPPVGRGGRGDFHQGGPGRGARGAGLGVNGRHPDDLLVPVYILGERINIAFHVL